MCDAEQAVRLFIRGYIVYRNFAFIVLIGLATAAHAELPSIRFDRIAPLGATVGSTIEVEIAGAEIDDVKTLWFDHPGLSAEPVKDKERWFHVSIAADVP